MPVPTPPPIKLRAINLTLRLIREAFTQRSSLLIKSLKRQQQFVCLLLSLLLIANQVVAAVFPPVSIFLQVGAQGQRPPDRQVPLLFPLERPAPPKRDPGPPPETSDLLVKLADLHSRAPQKLEMQPRERLSLPVIPLDSDGNALHGLKPQYQTSDSKVVGVLPDGRLVAGNPGRAQVTVRAGSLQRNFEVTVTGPPKQKTSRNSGSQRRSVKAVRTEWNAQAAGLQFQPAPLKARFSSSFVPASGRVSPAPMQSGPPPTQNHDIYATGRPPFRTEPSGSTPSAAMGSEERPGSANFSFAVPAVSLAGRGLDVALSLFYNSHLWNKSGSDYYYDEDKNWLAPGFALGLGKLTCGEYKINPSGQNYGTLNIPDVIQPDGTHHMLEGYGAFAPDGYIWRTYDGSQMRFIEAQPRVMRRNLSFLGTLYYPDGTAVEYGAGFASNVIDYGGNNFYSRNDTVFPTKITDRHGNYLIINYVRRDHK
jgi:hypothetical protein